MAVLDARTLSPGTVLTAPVVVVGAGAAGITLARALARRGTEVLLLEGGGPAPEAETQALHDVVPVGYPLRPHYINRAREFGGSCNLWAGRCMRLLPVDFEERDWVPGSGWPITAAALEPYMAEAAAILGLPPVENFALETHRSRLSGDESRLIAAGPFVPTVSLWARKPKRFARAYRRELSRSPAIRVLLHANVTRLALDAAGERVESVEIRTLDGRRLEARGRLVVLACGGLEVARLLLASNDRRPQGLGNGSGLVGRFFMDHPRTAYGRVVVREGVELPLMRTWPLARGKVQLGLAPTPEVQRQERLLHHYLTLEEEASGYAEQHYQTAIEVAKVMLRRGHAGSRLELGEAVRTPKLANFRYLLPPKEILPHEVWCAVRFAKGLLPRSRKERRYIVVYFCEQPPEAESRVALSAERDPLGTPKVLFDWRIPDSVHDTLYRLQERLARALEASGIGRLEPGEGTPVYTDASHHMGTTRMGVTPRNAVIDPDCRLFEVPNLFVASSAVFPSCGHANPTLTILALALRLADRLARELREPVVACDTATPAA